MWIEELFQNILMGMKKLNKRSRATQFDKYYDVIKELLDNNIKVFYYKSCLYRYMCDVHTMVAPESSFEGSLATFLNSIIISFQTNVIVSLHNQQ